MGSQTSLLAVSPHKTVVKLTHWSHKHWETCKFYLWTIYMILYMEHSWI